MDLRIARSGSPLRLVTTRQKSASAARTPRWLTASTEVEVGIVSVDATPYYMGNAPDLLGIAVPAFLDAFRDAEKQGYDAVVPLGTLDLGVDAGRCVVDIPMVGPSESMLHIAAMLGRRFGILMYDDSSCRSATGWSSGST